jgi:lipopolysaccharide transport system permease protein
LISEKIRKLTVVKPHAFSLDLELKELWDYRELLSFLVIREVKIRYKQTAIGVLWAILQPALTTLILAAIFSRVDRFSTGETPYLLYVLSGLLVWLFIFNGVSFGASSLLTNVNLITKIYFPRLILPSAAVIAGLLDMIVGLIIFIGIAMFFGIFPTLWILVAPLFLLQAVLLTLSLGWLLSALNVRFRDVKFALPFLLQIWMFISPLFYPVEILPASMRMLFSLNPLVGILHGVRSSLFDQPYDFQLIGTSLVVTFLISILSLLVFKKMEDSFAGLI